MLQQSCTVPRRQDVQWLRTNIFKSTCTIRGRVCTFIIDSGSSKNVTADEAVNKLGLIRENHPAPYVLGWITYNSSLRVTQRVLVPFSIRPHYKDRTYCDIAPMDISHLILGRPWEFNRISMMEQGILIALFGRHTKFYSCPRHQLNMSLLLSCPQSNQGRYSVHTHLLFLNCKRRVALSRYSKHRQSIH